MNIIVNGKPLKIDREMRADELLKKLGISADIFIVNTFVTSFDYVIKDNDEVCFIKKGVMPDESELEYQLISREGFGVYNRLKKSTVAVCGLGGLGSMAVVSLARAGVGRIKIYDFDIVEPSNLNRQYYFINQIGMRKVDALKETVEKINPFVKIESENIFLNSENIAGKFDDCNVILECFDNVESKLMLIEEGSKYYKDKLIIGASGLAGFYDTDLIVKKNIGKNILIVGDFENESGLHNGLTSTRAGVVGNIQANEAVRYILRDKDEY